MARDSSEASNKLTKEQKQAVGILSIGTFLEYFDLMLYGTVEFNNYLEPVT